MGTDLFKGTNQRGRRGYTELLVELIITICVARYGGQNYGIKRDPSPCY